MIEVRVRYANQTGFFTARGKSVDSIMRSKFGRRAERQFRPETFNTSGDRMRDYVIVVPPHKRYGPEMGSTVVGRIHVDNDNDTFEPRKEDGE